MCPQRAPVLPFNAVVNHRESSRGQRQLACTISNRSALDSLVMRSSPGPERPTPEPEVVPHRRGGLGRCGVGDQSSPKGSEEYVVEGLSSGVVDLAVRLHVGQVDNHRPRFRQHGDVLPAAAGGGVARSIRLTDDPPEQAVLLIVF